MRARVVKASLPEAIEEAANLIRAGGIVAFPTETVYGLGADAFNPLAVARVFEVKERPSMDPLIVHVASMDTGQSVGEIPQQAQGLLERFWPGPLTIVVRKRPEVPGIVTAGLDTVALRMPSHPDALALLRKSACAVAAPSANPFGYVSPTCAEHVAELLSDRIDLILDGGVCQIGLESTIVSVIDDPPRILRAGGLSRERIESVLGTVTYWSDPVHRPLAPGQLARHYATRTPLEIIEPGGSRAKPDSSEKVGLIVLEPISDEDRYAAVEVLSPSRDMREAAANLFSAMRRLDRLNLDRIVAHPVPEEGLGVAIMDRLRRCSARAHAAEGGPDGSA